MEGLPWPQARDRWQARLCWQCGGAERWGESGGGDRLDGGTPWAHLFWEDSSSSQQRLSLQCWGPVGGGAGWGPLAVGPARGGHSTERGG